MAYIFIFRLFLFIYLCSSLLLVLNALPYIPTDGDTSYLKNMIFRRQSQRSLDLPNTNHVHKSTTRIESRTRSVIMPRICYRARITGTNSFHKLCLPYNDPNWVHYSAINKDLVKSTGLFLCSIFVKEVLIFFLSLFQFYWEIESE